MALMICSGGGHLKQLHTLAPRLGVRPEEQVWVTFDNGLSRSLLADRDVHFGPFVAPRDLAGLRRFRALFLDVAAGYDFDRVFSTGSSPAVIALPHLARRGVEAHYIESAARAAGPSVTGRIVATQSKVATYTQYRGWESKRWQYRGSIFDAYEPGPARPTPERIRKAVVTVGTQEGYGFDRLYDALVPLLADCDEVLWQTGTQDVTRWGIEGRARVPHDELVAAVREADVVVAHSGTGSAISAFEQGKAPVLVPRLARFGEHVDDHQLQIAAEFDGRGLAIQAAPEALTTEMLLAAAARTVEVTEAGPIALQAPKRSRRAGSPAAGVAARPA